MKIESIESNKIKFDNGYELRYYHFQDCCENVYADFSVLKDYNTLGPNADKTVFDVEFRQDILDEIILVKDEGFKLRYYDEAWSGSIFVPCHNEQNGYYNDELSLILNAPGQSPVEIDISECCKDIF